MKRRRRANVEHDARAEREEDAQHRGGGLVAEDDDGASDGRGHGANGGQEDGEIGVLVFIANPMGETRIESALFMQMSIVVVVVVMVIVGRSGLACLIVGAMLVNRSRRDLLGFVLLQEQIELCGVQILKVVILVLDGDVSNIHSLLLLIIR
mgnify:CR=1 FL=1